MDLTDTEFCDGLKTLKILAEGGYFEQDNGAIKWPASLEAVLGRYEDEMVD